MKYFAKYLPVEGESNHWQWFNNIQNKGWVDISPSDMDAIIAHGLKPEPQFRKVQLFLCSRDIQVGDEYYNESFEFTKYPNKSIAGQSSEFVGYNDSYKIIGPISPQAVWVKEDDEFEEGEVRSERFDCFLPNPIMIKCPNCKTFH